MSNPESTIVLETISLTGGEPTRDSILPSNFPTSTSTSHQRCGRVRTIVIWFGVLGVMVTLLAFGIFQGRSNIEYNQTWLPTTLTIHIGYGNVTQGIILITREVGYYVDRWYVVNATTHECYTGACLNSYLEENNLDLGTLYYNSNNYTVFITEYHLPYEESGSTAMFVLGLFGSQLSLVVGIFIFTHWGCPRSRWGRCLFPQKS